MRRVGTGAALAAVLVLAACGGGTQASPSEEPTPTASVEASAEPSEDAGGGPAGLDAPAEVEAGAVFEVDWTGPDDDGDYVTLVPAGATEWTNADPYFDTSSGSPGSLVAPTDPGEYELWYVNGADDSVVVAVDVTVLPFEGALLAPTTVTAGTEFEVDWNGPDGPGDYVTLVPVGAEEWTSGDPYFDTSTGSPGKLYAPMIGGAYELWYVTGADDAVQAIRPVMVEPFEITLIAPERVAAGSEFEVGWTGPDGRGDYITIVPAGSDEGTYLSYAYTSDGPKVTLTAPDEPGKYEIWYASDREPGIFATIDIDVD